MTNVLVVVLALVLSWIVSGLYASRHGSGSVLGGWISLYELLSSPQTSSSNADAARSKPTSKHQRLPSRPLFGAVQAPCGPCHRKTPHSRNAVCRECETFNAELASKWNVIVEAQAEDEDTVRVETVDYEDAEVVDPDTNQQQDQEAPQGCTREVAADPILIPVLEEETDDSAGKPQEAFVLRENDQYDPVVIPPTMTPTDAPVDERPTSTVSVTHTTARPRIAIDLAQKLPSFDDLPARPKRGSVKTVCPTCQAKTRHLKDAACRVCGNQNRWLAQRWDLLPPGEAAVQPRRPDPTAQVQQTVEPVVSKVSVTQSGPWCGSCRRVTRADLYSACIFCGTQLEDHSK